MTFLFCENRHFLVGVDNDYRVEFKYKNGKVRSKKLRKDAVIGWAMIFKAPAEVTRDWTPERKRKFYDDSWKVMHKLAPNLFRSANVRMMATHRDEDGEHMHVIGDARDKDGRYCGNEIDRVLFDKINTEYPAMMRALGWDEMEDVERTDWNRLKLDEKTGEPVDPAYYAEWAEKRAMKPGGRSVNEYALAKAKERIEVSKRMYDDAGRLLQQAEAAEKEAVDGAEKAGKLIASATDIVRKLRSLEGEMDEKQRERLNLEMARGRRVRDTANRFGTELNFGQALPYIYSIQKICICHLIRRNLMA